MKIIWMLDTQSNNVTLNDYNSRSMKLYEVHTISFQYTHETLVPFEIISSGCNALVVPFQQFLEGPMEVLLCERVNDLRHSLFHLLFFEVVWFFSDLAFLFFPFFCLFPFFIISMVHFSKSNSIPISWLYIHIVCITFFSIFCKYLYIIHTFISYIKWFI